MIANLEFVERLATLNCGECEGYHLRYALRRAVDGPSGIDDDRLELIEHMRGLIDARAQNQAGAIHVLIAGAADTGILATCANAVTSLGNETASRVRYTVLDICETPLALCRAYGARHGLAIQTANVDLRRPESGFSADIIVLHSILRQLKPEYHTAVLCALNAWLAPDGRILFSNRLRVPNFIDRKKRAEMLLERHAKGEMKLPVPIDTVVASLGEPRRPTFDFAEPQDIRDLFRSADLSIQSERIVSRQKNTLEESTPPKMNSRYVAVLRRG